MKKLYRYLEANRRPRGRLENSGLKKTKAVRSQRRWKGNLQASGSIGRLHFFIRLMLTMWIKITLKLIKKFI
jgi:hypothetical protein